MTKEDAVYTDCSPVSSYSCLLAKIPFLVLYYFLTDRITEYLYLSMLQTKEHGERRELGKQGKGTAGAPSYRQWLALYKPK